MTIDPAYEAVAGEVRKARKALIAEAKRHPREEWLYPADLRARARNGWSSGAMGIALEALIEEDVFEVGGAGEAPLSGRPREQNTTRRTLRLTPRPPAVHRASTADPRSQTRRRLTH